MRVLIFSTLMALGVTSGVAAADNYRGEGRHEEIRGYRVVRDHRVEHYRDYHARPRPRYERYEQRRGYRWIGGEWRWNRGEWYWAPGHYVRIGRW
jgi:hypothetical protein